MTYGSVLVDFRPFQDPQESYFGPDKRTVNTSYPPEVWERCAFRDDGFRCFHLRTFRRWLWDRIDPADLRRADGGWYRGSGDSAFVYPMLELLGRPEHVRFVEDPIYVYRLHDGNVHRTDKASQHADLDAIRNQARRYRPLPRAELATLLGRAAG